MAGGFPVGQHWSNSLSYGASSLSRGTTITASASLNTKGSWTQLTASTTTDASWVRVIIDCTSSTSDGCAVDIGVGAAASEQVIIPNIMADTHSTPLIGAFYVPVNIKLGTRIAARCQSTVTNDTCRVHIETWDSGFASTGEPGIIDSYGFVSASTIGTSIDPGTTINTKGSYTQLTASTTADYQGFVLGFDHLKQASQGANSAFLVDVAVGAAASEQVILSNHSVFKLSNTNVVMSPFFSPYIPTPIPAGSRIAVRAQGAINTATARLFGIRFYGVRQ